MIFSIICAVASLLCGIVCAVILLVKGTDGMSLSERLFSGNKNTGPGTGPGPGPGTGPGTGPGPGPGTGSGTGTGTGTTEPSGPGTSTLKAPGELKPNEYLISPNKKWKLIFQGSDANVVIYGDDGKAKWASGLTSTNGGGRLALQNDGNLIVYDSKGNITWQWRSNRGSGPYQLVLSDDGRMTISGNNIPIESSPA
jgi:hypothetical protein